MFLGGIIAYDRSRDVILRNHMLRVLGMVVTSAVFEWMSKRTHKCVYVGAMELTWQIANTC